MEDDSVKVILLFVPFCRGLTIPLFCLFFYSNVFLVDQLGSLVVQFN